MLFNRIGIIWIVCGACLTSSLINPAIAKRKHHEPPRYTYGYYVAKGLLVPLPRPREDRVTPVEGNALADYLLPINRINEAFSALEDR